VQEK
jgi:hypothetical protein